jgi:hypothetical protein
MSTIPFPYPFLFYFLSFIFQFYFPFILFYLLFPSYYFLFFYFLFLLHYLLTHEESDALSSHPDRSSRSVVPLPRKRRWRRSFTCTGLPPHLLPSASSAPTAPSSSSPAGPHDGHAPSGLEAARAEVPR